MNHNSPSSFTINLQSSPLENYEWQSPSSSNNTRYNLCLHISFSCVSCSINHNDPHSFYINPQKTFHYKKIHIYSFFLLFSFINIFVHKINRAISMDVDSSQNNGHCQLHNNRYNLYVDILFICFIFVHQ